MKELVYITFQTTSFLTNSFLKNLSLLELNIQFVSADQSHGTVTWLSCCQVNAVVSLASFLFLCSEELSIPHFCEDVAFL